MTALSDPRTTAAFIVQTVAVVVVVFYAVLLVRLLVQLAMGDYSFIATAGMFGLIVPHFYFCGRIARKIGFV